MSHNFVVPSSENVANIVLSGKTQILQRQCLLYSLILPQSSSSYSLSLSSSFPVHIPVDAVLVFMNVSKQLALWGPPKKKQDSCTKVPGWVTKFPPVKFHVSPPVVHVYVEKCYLPVGGLET